MGTMDDDLFHAIVDQLAGRHVLLLQPFLMNEPLMDKQIVPRLAYMKAKVPGARINITTNGVLLRPALVAELARLDLDSIHVSSNGLASDTYRETMGIDGAEVLANVNHLADAAARGRGQDPAHRDRAPHEAEPRGSVPRPRLLAQPGRSSSS